MMPRPQCPWKHVPVFGENADGSLVCLHRSMSRFSLRSSSVFRIRSIPSVTSVTAEARLLARRVIDKWNSLDVAGREQRCHR
eukprot:2689112-Lingulodinium_polyedra.AAC.1